MEYMDGRPGFERCTAMNTFSRIIFGTALTFSTYTMKIRIAGNKSVNTWYVSRRTNVSK